MCIGNKEKQTLSAVECQIAFAFAFLTLICVGGSAGGDIAAMKLRDSILLHPYNCSRKSCSAEINRKNYFRKLCQTWQRCFREQYYP